MVFIKRKRPFRLIACLSICLFGLNANILADNIPDTIHVDEVVITAENISKFQTGAKIENLKIGKIELLQDCNLEQVLNRLTPVSFKSMAGGLSTIRFRGTSPDHTSINFGGININSLTLGHSNVSNVPMYLFDKVGVQYGSSSAVNGSGSIGGAIHLGLKSYWVNGVKAEARSAYSSIGEQFYGTKIFVGNGKFEAVTRAYYYFNKNQFKYFYNDFADFETNQRGKYDTQRNAVIENKGLIQEFNYKLAANESIKVMAWFEDDWHLIQQNMATNADTNKRDYKEPLQNESVRIWAAYNNRKNKFKYHAGAGYVFDNTVHNNSPNEIITQRFVSDVYAEHDITDKSSYKLGLKGQTISPSVYAYDANLNKEHRADVFFLYKQALLKRLNTTLNLRKGFVSNYAVPFTPSVGLSYLTFSNEFSSFKLLGNIARNYKVPTFNDRFWVPGGNPKLKPEQGINYELGAKYNFVASALNGNMKLNVFYMDVDNWILWRNKGSYWGAENVLRVVSKGAEFSADFNYSFGENKLLSGLVYAFTSTQRAVHDSVSSAAGRQMEYVPLHTCKLFSTLEFKSWSFGFDGQMMPWQYTDETDKNILDGYFLLNLNAQKKIMVNNSSFLTLRALLNNVLNVNYQSSIGYAMPRFNAKISVSYNFN